MKKINRIRHFILILIFSILLCGISIYTFYIKEEETVSLFENRNLALREDIENSSFFDNTLQDSLENVLADQFLYRQKIVEIKKQFDRNIELTIYGQNTDDLVLTKMGDTNIYQLGSSNYMMNGLMAYDERIEKCIINRVEQINDIAKDYPDIEFYLYRPIQAHETSLFDEVNETQSYGVYYNDLFKKYTQIPLAYLTIETIDDYKEMFYSSDHHWNYRGSYQGYVDIMTLMGMEKDILEPESIFCNEGATFYGTFSTRTANVLGPDKYCIYDVNYADVKVYAGDTLVEDILNPKYYIEHAQEYASDPYLYHYNYSSCQYFPYIKMETGNKDKENILVIGDSYARSIAHYMASSFNESYFVNQTDYLNTTGHYFNYDEFLEEHHIDKVLFMYTIENYFATDATWGDIYKNFDVHRKVVD